MRILHYIAGYTGVPDADDNALPPQPVTVRQWFRFSRAASVTHDWAAQLLIYFRQEPENSDYGPFHIVPIYRFMDLYDIVQAGTIGDPPAKVAQGLWQMEMLTTHRPGAEMTH